MPHYNTSLTDARTVGLCPAITTPADTLMGARLSYYQTEKTTDGLPRVMAVGTITGIKAYASTTWVRIEPDDERLFAKWHIFQDTFIAWVWTARPKPHAVMCEPAFGAYVIISTDYLYERMMEGYLLVGLYHTLEAAKTAACARISARSEAEAQRRRAARLASCDVMAAEAGF